MMLDFLSQLLFLRIWRAKTSKLGNLKRALYGLNKQDVMNARGVIKLRLAIHLAGAGAGSGSPIVENVKTLRCGNVTMRRFRLWLIAQWHLRRSRSLSQNRDFVTSPYPQTKTLNVITLIGASLDKTLCYFVSGSSITVRSFDSHVLSKLSANI